MKYFLIILTLLFNTIILRSQYTITPSGPTDFCEGDSVNLSVDNTGDSYQWYQDTNPIQEEIYFKMAENSPHNLVVVGDDDQALYRFRGGTVESMVTFSQKCESRWDIPAFPVQLKN